jgi:hypothetical protein
MHADVAICSRGRVLIAGRHPMGGPVGTRAAFMRLFAP